MTHVQRSTKKWLAKYPNLVINHNGIFTLRTPTWINPQRPRVNLAVKYDGLGEHGQAAVEAIVLYSKFIADWQSQRLEKRADAMLKTVKRAENPGEKLNFISFKAYAEYYREKWLPKAVTKSGEPLGKLTKKDYDGLIRGAMGKSDLLEADIAVIHANECRTFLAGWLGKPKTYNHLKTVMSRVFKHAIDEGLRNSNPADEIAPRPHKKVRDVYMPDDHFREITKRLELWEAKACDLLLLVTGRPENVLHLQDACWKKAGDNGLRKGEIFSVDHLCYYATKNKQYIELEMNADLVKLLKWFQDFKVSQNFISPYFIVYSRENKRKYWGKPVSVGYLSNKFRDAAIEAGYYFVNELGNRQATYQLRDIRPKGISDEISFDKENNKGGHLTDTARRGYIRVPNPIKVKNNLTLLSERKTQS